MGQKAEQTLNLSFDVSELTPAQVRQVKTLNALLIHLLKTAEENEFFDSSAEFMRISAALIKQANFTSGLKGVDDIPYADQALEYSLDVLQDFISSSKVITYDN